MRNDQEEISVDSIPKVTMHNWIKSEEIKRGAVMKAWSQFEKMIEQTNEWYCRNRKGTVAKIIIMELKL